jgi:hypothetical protein
MEEEQKIIRLENEKIKVVFTNEVNPDESSLTLEFTITRDSNDQKVTTLALDPSLFDREDSFMGEMYMNTVNTLGAVKKIFDSGEIYKGLHLITTDEYKEFLIKVKGVDPETFGPKVINVDGVIKKED